VKVRTVTIVTPCRNAEALVGRTALSIVGQTAVRSGRLRLQYLVCDGASTDGTLEAVRRACGPAADILSEPDGGMYDALWKGLRRAEGEVVAYLNAGDLYAPTALDVVADVFEAGGVEWLTGLRVAHDDRGRLLWSEPQYGYRRELLRAGAYGGRLLSRFVQQESTFWRRELHDEIEPGVLTRLKLAGDCYLWTRFARRADLRRVEAHLGGFAYHAGQKSEDRRGYAREVASFAERAGPRVALLAAWDALAWRIPPLRALVHHRGVIRRSRAEGRWVDPCARAGAEGRRREAPP
jgi:glycosyltransferase involved in cell wall biosynthesis